MAFGVSAVFPRARFIHASAAPDIRAEQLDCIKTVILVDSVINSRKTVVEFIDHVRKLNDGIRIVVVAGVVHEEAVRFKEHFHGILQRHGIPLVALRLSDNKFTGTKGTDTGNHLFNTAAWV